jgi:hypothetical protein
MLLAGAAGLAKGDTGAAAFFFRCCSARGARLGSFSTAMRTSSAKASLVSSW